MERMDTIPRLPPRKPDSHKGDYGRVFVLGGSRGLAGAACLCSDAALRAGAGLVTVGVPESVYPIVATKLTCCMTRALPETPYGTLAEAGRDELAAELARWDVIALGPGISQNEETARVVRWLAAHLDKPMVIDADGLNCLAASRPIALRPAGSSPPASRILTPHPGEMARLADLRSAAEVQKDREEIAAAFAREHAAVVALKGHETVVTDGSRTFINPTGNPGMATAGSGDVLTGVVAALLAQMHAALDAATLGVYVHGLAGDIAAREKGQVSLTASDILDALPAAFVHLDK